MNTISNEKFDMGIPPVCISGSVSIEQMQHLFSTPITQKDDGVQAFFEMLGYTVRWDRNRNGAWFELYDDGLVAQIDMGVSLDVIIEDMIAWHLGKNPSARPDKPYWVCSGEEGPEMKELFRRVYNFKVFSQLPNGQLQFPI